MTIGVPSARAAPVAEVGLRGALSAWTLAGSVARAGSPLGGPNGDFLSPVPLQPRSRESRRAAAPLLTSDAPSVFIGRGPPP